VNCDPIARWYRWLEYFGFGRALERRRFAFLAEAIDARRILILGEGDGRFLAKLVQENRSAVIDCADLSGKMLELARARAGTDRITYHHADALTLPLPEAEYDLIVTHFFLDCLEDGDAAALVSKIAGATLPGAQWIVSEFREPSAWAGAIVGMLYFFFRITTGLRARTLIDHRGLLLRHGLVLMREENGRFGLLASELWAFGDNKSR
jgi:ubiquinone/menaquinone biosynthesis C-methylase UbiE